MIPAAPLLLIADPASAAGDYLRTVSAALANGCRWVMVRAKGPDAAALPRLSRGVMALARPYGAAVAVNGDARLSRRMAGSGVHLPQGHSLPEARRIVGTGIAIGVSVHSAREALAAERDGADYLLLSPVFPTSSKPGYGPPLGLDGLARIVAQVSPPVVALGGIAAENVRGCMAAGAEAVAVMGGVMAAPDPGDATVRILRALRESGQGGSVARPQPA